jgi:hypothetical protein
MTSQKRADRELAIWQQNRHLTPRERMAKLLDDCFTRPAVSETQFEADLRAVADAMVEVPA